MLPAMRIAWLAVASVVVLGCKGDPPAERKVRKFDVHAAIDDRGRLKLAFRLFDAKHELMPVTGSYTGEVAKLDGTVLCKAAGELAPKEFTAKGTHQATWLDAKCPLDPDADELKVNVTLVATGAGDKDKDGKATDRNFDRSMTLPVKSLYERPPGKKPTESAVKPAESAVKPAEPAVKPAEPITPEKPEAAPAKPADPPAAKATGSGSAS